MAEFVPIFWASICRDLPVRHLVSDVVLRGKATFQGISRENIDNMSQLGICFVVKPDRY